MATKSYFINSASSIKGDPTIIKNLLEGEGNTINISDIELTKLKNYAFADSTASEISLPETLTSIGRSCFEGCSNLTSLNLRNVEILPYYSLFNCNNLVYLQCTPKAIGSYVFQNANNISKDNFSTENVRYIGEQTFSNNIKNFSLPNLKGSSNYSLRYATRVPDSLISLGAYNYYSYSNNSDYDLVENRLCYKRSETNDHAWLTYCNSSGDVVLNENTKGISSQAFQSKTLTSLTLPESLEHFSYTWSYYSNLGKLNIPSLDWWFSRDFYGYNSAVTDVINGNPVLETSSMSLINNWNQPSWEGKFRLYVNDVQVDNVTEIEIPETAGMGCLSTFDNLERVTINIPELHNYGNRKLAYYFSGGSRSGFSSRSLSTDSHYKQNKKQAYNGNQEIITYEVFNQYDNVSGYSTGTVGGGFYFPTKLNEINIKGKNILLSKVQIYDIDTYNYLDSVENIKIDTSFYGKNITLPSTLKSLINLQNDLNNNSSFLEDIITFNAGNTVLEDFPVSFINKKSLTSCILPQNVKTILPKQFYDCTKLNSINIPGKVSTIEDSAFSNAGLTAINIPSSIESIGDNAFGRCKSLNIISFSDSKLSIGRRAFANCNIQDLVVPNASIIDQSAFEQNLNLISANINAENVSSNVFYGCSSLQSVVFGNNTKVLGTTIFSGSNFTYLTSLTLPSSLEKIETNAFIGLNSAPVNVTYLGTIEQWNSIEKGTLLFNGARKTIHCTDGDTTSI